MAANKRANSFLKVMDSLKSNIEKTVATSIIEIPLRGKMTVAGRLSLSKAKKKK